MKTNKKKKFPACVDEAQPIKCDLLERTRYAGMMPNYEPDIKKKGTYHASVWHDVEGWGVNRWVVMAVLDVDHKRILSEGKTVEELLAGCFAYLNQPPERKKYQRRRRKPLYGNLEPFPHRYGFKEIDGKEYIWVAMVTDKRKCKEFFGEGFKI